MEDGSKAVGLFNRGDEPASVQVPYSNLGFAGGIEREFRQQDLGLFSDSFAPFVPRHGVVLVRIF